jgi:dihydroxyacetone kinase-like predicted kinase
MQSVEILPTDVGAESTNGSTTHAEAEEKRQINVDTKRKAIDILSKYSSSSLASKSNAAVLHKRRVVPLPTTTPLQFISEDTVLDDRTPPPEQLVEASVSADLTAPTVLVPFTDAGTA